MEKRIVLIVSDGFYNYDTQGTLMFKRMKTKKYFRGVCGVMGISSPD